MPLFRRFLETVFGGAILPGSVAFIRSIDSASASATAIITYFTLIFCLNCGQQAVRDKALLREVFERYRGENTTYGGRGEEGGVSTAPQNSDLITVNSDEEALHHEDILLLYNNKLLAVNWNASVCQRYAYISVFSELTECFLCESNFPFQFLLNL